MKRGCVIVAGGKGLRMGGDIPKQYMEIGDLPILMRTVQALKAYDSDMLISIAVPKDDIAYVDELRRRYLSNHGAVLIVGGGETRTDSVHQGLMAMPDDVVRVGVHDGVRPFVSPEMLARLFETNEPSVIPVIPCTDSVRLKGEDDGYRPLDRSLIGLVQTPQVFDAETLRRAYRSYDEQRDKATFTDDASLVEGLLGITPKTVEGDELNIKITTPKDMILGAWIASIRDGA